MLGNTGRALSQGRWVRKSVSEEIMIRLSFKGEIGISPTENERAVYISQAMKNLILL